MKIHINRGYVFTLTVKGPVTKQRAEMAVLAAFAARQPDGCKFHLSKKETGKDAYMAGAASGVQIGFDLALRALEAQMRRLDVKRIKGNYRPLWPRKNGSGQSPTAK